MRVHILVAACNVQLGRLLHTILLQQHRRWCAAAFHHCISRVLQDLLLSLGLIVPNLTADLQVQRLRVDWAA